MDTPTRVATDQHARAAQRLQQAAADRTPCPPIRDLLGAEADPAAQMAFGYSVQRLLTKSAEEAGRRVVGAKIGLTSEAVQEQLGVDSPDSGVLFADMAR